jgi:F-type H+-transporting ATPase subunit epsilon
MSESVHHFKFEVVSPERVVLKTNARQVSIPTLDGEITVLPFHVPLVSLLKPGVIEVVLENGERDIMAVSGGLLEVLADKVVILADSAERAEELDEAAIEAAHKRAAELKEQAQNQNDIEFTRLSALIEKEVARSHALKRWKNIRVNNK